MLWATGPIARAPATRSPRISSAPPLRSARGPSRRPEDLWREKGRSSLRRSRRCRRWRYGEWTWRRSCHFSDLLDRDVRDAGEIALGKEKVALVLSIEVGGIDRAGEVSDEHSVAENVEGDANSLHQMRDQDLRYRLFVDRHPIDRVPARRIAAVGPIEDAVRSIEFEVDGLGQPVEKHLDVGTICCALAFWDLDVCAAEAARSALRRTFLRPVEFPKLRIDGDANAPSGLIAPIVVAPARFDQRFDERPVEVRGHPTHARTVAPVEPEAVLIEMDLFRRVRNASRNNDPAIPTVEIGTLDRAVVKVGHTHIGPIDVTRLHIDGDPVGEMAIGDNGLAVGAVEIHRVNAVTA